MIRVNFKAFYVFLCVFCLQAIATENPLGPRVEKVRIRHIEPHGLGYKYGYSSLDLLLTIPNTRSHFMPLLDLRGHIFNNGDWAANSGLGLRYLSDSLAHVFGANAFYDYRSTDKNHYNQVSMGLEALGRKWDFRVNGYLLIGEKRSSPFDFDFNLDAYLLTAKRDYAMSGLDGEVGYHFPKIKWIDFYGAIGPYFYASQKMGENTTGGRFRVVATILNYLSLEGLVSYDHLFRWIGQGSIALNFSFGSKKVMPSSDSILKERLLQVVGHNEIIVLKKNRKNL
ncbi:MAG: inverse autotransporter beta domain-containing protein [Chlamydiota bacterium]